MDRGQVSRIVAAGYAAAALLVLTGSTTAYAGPTPQDGWAHRSTQEVSPDGFSVRSTSTPQNVSPDGFAVRSTEAPKEISPDGFAVRSTEAPKQISPDGFAVRSQTIGQDGWAAASVELPRPSVVQDGWATRTTTEPIAASGIDGWSYGAVQGDAPASIAHTQPAPPRSTSPSTSDMVGFAAVLAAAALAGVMFEVHRRHQRHHLPI